MTTRIHLDVPGSTPEQREAGVRHALGVLVAAGFDLEFAQLCYLAREAWQAAGQPRGGITDPQIEAAATFNLARLAAIEACIGAEQIASEACSLKIYVGALH